MALSNSQLWDYLRGKYPNFANHTSKATADLFTARGFEQLQSYDASILNDYFGLSLRVFLQKVTSADVKDLLEGQGFGEAYDTPFGGFIQRMSINSLKPVSPAYKGLENGDAPDPYVVRKPSVSEQIFVQNFDYQSLVTMPDEATYKNMFINEFGMSEFMAGVMKALNNGYIAQKYNNKLEALNAAINSVTYALKDTQKYQLEVADTDTLTATEIIAFIKLVRDIVDAMVYTPATGAYNQGGFETTQDTGRLKILMRPSFANKLATISKLNSMEDMSLPVDIVKVPDFGGLKPYVMSGETKTYLQPIYDSIGTQVAYVDAGVTVNGPAHYDKTSGKWIVNVTSGGTTADTTQTVTTCEFEDPNAGIQAVIADKGLIFESIQNPYTVEPARNARGLYTNYWASSPNNAISVYRYKNLVTVQVVEAQT